MHYPTLEEKIATVLAKKYAGQNSLAFRADELRLKHGEPLEYVLGYAEFLGCKIDISCRPMIPRYETAFWVDRAIKELAEQNRSLRVADTFAGSGNVGIAILKHVPHTIVEFSELDASLLPGIAHSVDLNKIDPARAKLIAANALEGLTGQYDDIFAVPPYVSPNALSELDPEMRDHEPHLAFFAEEGGRAFHRLLIEKAWDYLLPGGTLYMESDMDHEAGTRKMLEGTKWSKVEFWPDPYDATPNVVLRK